ncbi:hypothetical protein TNCV_4182721 [Trichonephila clavipes]|nr:hypothetical protein TNCV_4182721 [Trichonephila clavipes]
MLGRRIAARPRLPATVRVLEIALLEEWNSIPQSLIDNLIASMANRATEVALEKLKIFFEVDCPRILQSDNGREFTVAVIQELKKYVANVHKIVNGRPRHPSSQGSVE